MPSGDPFPVEAARDMLGLVRAIYRAMRAAGGGYVELRRVEVVGRKLARAIEVGRDARPGTVACTSAHVLANEAVAELDDAVDLLFRAQPILDAARAATSAPPRRRGPRRAG